MAADVLVADFDDEGEAKVDDLLELLESDVEVDFNVLI